MRPARLPTRRDVGCLALAGAATLVGSGRRPGATPPSDPVRIGVVGPFTGNAAPVGVAIRNGVAMAVADALADGRLPVRLDGIDRDVELRFIDTGNGRDATAAQVTAAITDDGVRLFVGGWYGGAAMQLMDLAARYQVVHIGHLAETPLIAYRILAEPERFAGWFKSWPSAPMIAAQYAAPLDHFLSSGQWRPHARQAAVVVERTVFGDSWGEAFEAGLTAAGFAVRPYDSVRLAELDYRDLLASYASAGVSLIAVVTSRRTSAIAFLDQYRRNGMLAAIIGHGFSWFADLNDRAPNRDAGVLSMDRPYPVLATQQEWVARYRDRFGIAPDILFAGHVYDYTHMLFAALDQVGQIDTARIADALRAMVHRGVWQQYDFADRPGINALAPNEIITGPFMAGFAMPMAQSIAGERRVIWPLEHAEAAFQPPPGV